MGLTTGVIWYFVWDGLQEVGGYQVVADNHARYFVGWPGWVDSLRQQWEKQLLMNSLFGYAGLAVATLIGVLVILRRGDGATEKVDNLLRWGLVSMSSVLLMLGLGGLFGATTVIMGITLLAALWFLVKFRGFWKLPESYVSDSRLAGWMLLAWFTALTIAVPLYYPYPRLAVPWILSACLGAGWFAQMIRDKVQLAIAQTDTGVLSPAPIWAKLAAMAVALGGAALFMYDMQLKAGTEQDYVAMEDRSRFGFIGQRIIRTCLQDTKADLAKLETNAPFVVYVYGEPAMFYHLRSQYPDVGPVGELDHIAGPKARKHDRPTYVLIGPHQKDMLIGQGENRQVKGYEEELVWVEEFLYHSPLLVELDERIGEIEVPEEDQLLDEEGKPIIGMEVIALFRVK